jgi:hypothetical protein
MKILKCVLMLLVSFSCVLYSQVPTEKFVQRAVWTQSEPAIAVTDMDNTPGKLQLAAWNHIEPSITRPGYAFSTNGGSTWAPHLLPLPTQYLLGGVDPSIAFRKFDGITTAFYAYLRVSYDPLNYSDAVYVSRTTDLGTNWEDRLVSDVAYEDKPYMTVDDYIGSPYYGNVYVCWVEVSGGMGGLHKIKCAFSTDQGQSFQSREIDEAQDFPPSAFLSPSFPLPEEK